MASEKGLTLLARAKRWAKQLKGGESTYISKERKNEMDVARLIKDYNARQAKKKPSKPKEKPKPKAEKSFETTRTTGLKSELGHNLSKKEIEKLRKK